MSRTVLTILLLTLLAGASQAQEPTGEPAAEPPAAPAKAEAVAGREDQDDPDDAAGEPDSEASPFDYQSSEQISEDLSVSFPVDI